MPNLLEGARRAFGTGDGLRSFGRFVTTFGVGAQAGRYSPQTFGKLWFPMLCFGLVVVIASEFLRSSATSQPNSPS